MDCKYLAIHLMGEKIFNFSTLNGLILSAHLLCLASNRSGVLQLLFAASYLYTQNQLRFLGLIQYCTFGFTICLVRTEVGDAAGIKPISAYFQMQMYNLIVVSVE